MNEYNQDSIELKVADFHREAAEYRKAHGSRLIGTGRLRSSAARLLRSAADRLEPGLTHDNKIPTA